jgi:hypothetical protein
MYLRLLTVIIYFLVSAGSASAGPPLLTHDTDTPGNNNWEINIAYTLEQRQTEDTHTIPVIDINYGIGDNIQIKYEVLWLVLDEKDVGTKSGLGNSALGLKWRFYNDKQYGLAMSVYPQFEFNNPTSSAQRVSLMKEPFCTCLCRLKKPWGPDGSMRKPDIHSTNSRMRNGYMVSAVDTKSGKTFLFWLKSMASLRKISRTTLSFSISAANGISVNNLVLWLR